MNYQDKSARYADALARAENPRSASNIALVYEAAGARGLVDAEPGLNVLTFDAWKARGRHVRRGEKALCLLLTWVPMSREEENGETVSFKRPRRVAVFHVSQTEAKS